MLRFKILDSSNISNLAKPLTELSLRCSRGNPSSNYWQWCYLDNPIGKSYTSIAIKEDDVVGKNGNVPIPLSICGEKKIAVLMEGLVVDEVHRSWECTRGLLSTSYLQAAKDNLEISYSFSTKAATKISETFGSKTTGQMPIQSLCLNVEKLVRSRFLPFPLSLVAYLLAPFLSARNPQQINKELEIKIIQNFDATTNKTWQQTIDNNQITVVKESSYLNWRYSQHPDIDYIKVGAYKSEKCHGFIVFRLDKKSQKGYILELVTQDFNVGIALVRHVLQAMKQQDISLVTASFPEASLPRKCLASFGFRSWSTRFWDMHLVVLADPKKTSTVAQDFNKWNFSLGDWIYF